MIDQRVLRIGIELDGVIKYITGLNIKASGSKTNNSTQNEFSISISNLNRETRAYILTNNNILNRDLTNKRIIVEAGRESTGLSLVYSGDIKMVSTSQPPDITLNIKTYTGDTYKSDLVSVTEGASTNLSVICQKIATGLKRKLIFQATDRKISNYSFTGANLEQIKKIEDLGNLDVFVDDENMVVKNENVPLNGLVRLVNKNTGMIGIPTITERGVSVKVLYDNQMKIGTKITVKSELNPAADGDYTIYKLGYDLANRDNSFYVTCEGTRV
jgi:hypothetical protein